MKRLIAAAFCAAALGGCATPGQFGGNGKPSYFNATVQRVESSKQKVAPPHATTTVGSVIGNLAIGMTNAALPADLTITVKTDAGQIVTIKTHDRESKFYATERVVFDGGKISPDGVEKPAAAPAAVAVDDAPAASRKRAAKPARPECKTAEKDGQKLKICYSKSPLPGAIVTTNCATSPDKCSAGHTTGWKSIVPI